MYESARRTQNPDNVMITPKPHSSFRYNLVHVKDPGLSQQRRGVIYKDQCSRFDKICTGLKKPRSSVKRHTRNSCLTPQYMNIGICNLTKASEAIITQRSEEHSVNPFMQFETCYRSLRELHLLTCFNCPHSSFQPR